MSTVTPVIAVMLAQRNRIISALRTLGALSPSSAVPSSVLPVRELRQYRYLTRRGVLKSRPDGALYLDEEQLAIWKAAQRHKAGKLVIAALLAAAVLAGAAYYLTSAKDADRPRSATVSGSESSQSADP